MSESDHWVVSAVPDRKQLSIGERLAAMIIGLQLPPGMLVSESKLAAVVGASRAEVREALRELRETGLVTILPRAGIAVSEIGLVDVQNVFEARVALEPAIARLAAQRASDSDIGALRSLANQSERYTRGGETPDSDTEPRDFVELDRLIHSEVGRVARNPILDRALGRVLLVNARAWRVFFERNGPRAGTFVSHAKLIDAIQRHDPDAAEDAVRQHLESSGLMLRRAFEGGF